MFWLTHFWKKRKSGPINRGLHPISHYLCLDKASEITCPLFIACQFTGWGRLSGSGPAADTLQQGQLPIVSHQDCAKKYTRYEGNTHLCAGEGTSAGSGACSGDSGGPLVCEVGGRWYLHGVVSFGKRNCPTTHYTVFARVTSYIYWITERIGMKIRSRSLERTQWFLCY